MEEVVGPDNYGKALKAVIANQGAPGIDGMRTEELNGHLCSIGQRSMASYWREPMSRVL